MKGTKDNNNPEKSEITNMYLVLSRLLVGSIDEFIILYKLFISAIRD
jgi:hypothetical protein